MSCACDRLESKHHHGWGGTYPCEGPELCIRCQPIEVAVHRVPRHLYETKTVAVNTSGEDEPVVPAESDPS